MLLTGGSGTTPADIVGYGVPVLSHTWFPSGPVASSALSDGVNTWGIRESRHVALQACSQLRLVYAAITAYEDPAGAVATSNIPGTITVAAVVWKQTARPSSSAGSIDVPWGAGTTVDMTDGQIAVSDALPSLTLAQGDILWIRTLVTVPSGGKWPIGKRGVGLVAGYDGEAVGNGTAPDLHTSTVAATNGSQLAFHPTTVLGVLA